MLSSGLGDSKVICMKWRSKVLTQDTGIFYNSSPQCEPCRVMVKNCGLRSGF